MPPPVCVLPFDECRILVSPWLGYLRLRSSGPEIIEAGGYHFDLYESNPLISLDKNPVGLILPDHYAATGCGVSFIWDNNYIEQWANPYTIDISLPATLVPSSTTIVDESRVDVESLVNVTPISGNATIDYAGAVYPTPREFEAAFQMEASSIMTDLVNPCPFRLVQTARRSPATYLAMVKVAEWHADYEESATLDTGESFVWNLTEAIPVSTVYETEVNPDAIYVLIVGDNLEGTFTQDLRGTEEVTTSLFGGGFYRYHEFVGTAEDLFEQAGVQVIVVAWDGTFPDLSLTIAMDITALFDGTGVLEHVSVSTKLWMLIPAEWL